MNDNSQQKPSTIESQLIPGTALAYRTSLSTIPQGLIKWYGIASESTLEQRSVPVFGLLIESTDSVSHTPTQTPTDAYNHVHITQELLTKQSSL